MDNQRAQAMDRLEQIYQQRLFNQAYQQYLICKAYCIGTSGTSINMQIQSSKDEKDNNSIKNNFWTTISSIRKSPEPLCAYSARSKSAARMFYRVRQEEQNEDTEDYEGGAETESQQADRQKKASTFKVMVKNFKNTWSQSPRAQRRKQIMAKSKQSKAKGSTAKGIAKEVGSAAKAGSRGGLTKAQKDEAASPPAASASKDAGACKESWGISDDHGKKSASSESCPSAPSNQDRTQLQVMFARPKQEMKNAYLSPLCSNSQTQQSAECGQPRSSPTAHVHEERQYNGKAGDLPPRSQPPTRVDKSSKQSADEQPPLLLDSVDQLKQQRSLSADSIAMARSARPAPAGHYELAAGQHDHDSHGRTNSDHNQLVVDAGYDVDLRDQREYEQLRVSILQQELADGRAQYYRAPHPREYDSKYGSETSIEGGDQDGSRNQDHHSRELDASEPQPTPSIHNLPDRRENSNMREDNFSQEGKKIIKFSSKTRLPLKEGDERSEHNGGDNLDLKMNVQFEESQVPSPMSFNRDENREQKSVTHIFGMQKQKHDDSSSESMEREDLLQEHHEKYAAYKAAHAAEASWSQKWEYSFVLKQMQDEPIKCIKYNYSIDPEGQNHLQFDALLQVSQDGKELAIYNKKPNDNPEYIPEAAPDEVKKQRELYKLRVKKKQEKMEQKMKDKSENKDTEETRKDNPKEFRLSLPEMTHEKSESSIDDSYNNNEEEGDIDLDEKQELEKLKDQFNLKKSSASTDIDDIQGIIYGGISSRFWVYRKHLICMDYDKIKKNSKHNRKFDGDKSGVIPFFAWQCVTLQLKDRYVDLVIKNEQKMKLFLKFLVMSLNTIDGSRGTAEKAFQQLYLREVMRREKMLKKTCYAKKGMYKKEALVLSEEAKQQIMVETRREIYQKTFFKYTLMKIRSKIAYQAFQSRMSINELFISQISDSYEILTENGDIPKVADYSQECIEKFDAILDGDFNSCMQKLIQHNLDPVVRQRKETLYRQRELKDLGLKSLDQLESKALKQNVGNLFANNIAKLLHAKEDAFLRKQELVMGKKKATRRDISDDGLSKDSTVKSEGAGGDRHPGSLRKQKLKKFNNDEKEEKQPRAEAGGNLQTLQGGFGLFDKTKCMDIFANVKVDGMQMYDQRSTKAKFHYKVIRKIIEKQLTKVKFMIAVGGLIDIFYIKCMLRKISLMKKMFVLELEQGQEVFIPNDLTCDNYPISYHYYDPIIQIVNHFFSAESRLYFTLKTEFNLSRLKDSDWQKQFLIKLGVYESDETCKLTYKHQLINIKERDELKHTESQHSLSLQKSRYLIVESNAERLKNLADFQVSQKALEANRAGSTIILDHAKSIEDMPLNLRFCHKDEVNLKRQKFVHFKQCFLVRQDHLKNQGQKFHSLVMMQRHIEKNIDKIYEENCANDEHYRRYRETTNPNFGKEQEKQSNKKPHGNDSEDDEGDDPEFRREQEKFREQREKAKYAAYLLDAGERLIKKRRAGMRRKGIKLVNARCDKSIDFAQKNAFLEEKIETTQKYFNYMNDFHHPGQDLQKIRKQLYKVSKRVKKAKTLSMGGNQSNGNMSQVENNILQKKASMGPDSSSGMQNPSLMDKTLMKKKKISSDFSQVAAKIREMQAQRDSSMVN